MAKRHSKPELVVRRAPMWNHRTAFSKSFAEVAKCAIDELLNNIYPIYQKAREGFAESFGIIENEQVKGESHVLISTGVYTPFSLFDQIAREHGPDGEQEANLEKRKELKATLLTWAERHYVSPRFWSTSNTWFLDRTLGSLSSLYSFPEKTDFRRELAAGGYVTYPAEANVPIQIDRSFKWTLTKESKHFFKKRVKSEIGKMVDSQLEEIYAREMDRFLRGGFAKPERRQDYGRDMGWLVRHQCLKRSYEEIADTAPPDITLDAVRKVLERRAEDIKLILWTKT